MDILHTGTCVCAALFVVWCVQVQSEQSCDHTEFLHPNGTCVACPACEPGQQLSEDCGFGDGGDGVCTPCEDGKFSSDSGVAPCSRCTTCNLLNRLQRTPCSPTTDALCGQCLPGYYELRSVAGAVELFCIPCYRHDTAHKECLLFKSQTFQAKTADLTESRGNVKDPEEKRVEEEKISVVLIGSATASSMFVIALLLWAFVLTSKRFKQAPECSPRPEEHLPATTTSPSVTERDVKQSHLPSQGAEEYSRSLNSLSHESEAPPPPPPPPPTSIVINVTTNIKPSRQKTDHIAEEGQQRSCYTTDEMEQKLQTIWEMAQGHSIEMLDYDSVQDLSLLLDSADRRNMLRRLGRTLGVPPQVLAHLQGFQDLFQYLRTSTYTLLPQLAQAAALLPNPEIVARIHRAVVNK